MSCPKPKLDTILEKSSFSSMKADAKIVTTRKGTVGDWENYLNLRHWAEFDAKIEAELGDSKLYAPLKKYGVPSPGTPLKTGVVYLAPLFGTLSVLALAALAKL